MYEDALNVHLDKVLPVLDSTKIRATFHVYGHQTGKYLIEPGGQFEREDLLGKNVTTLYAHPRDRETFLGKFKIDQLCNEDQVLEFFVKDTGIGIPLNRQNAIFNRFEQSDIEDLGAYEGAGLGLAISKSYVEMLGGDIWVESEQGRGASFYFSLPCSISGEETFGMRDDSSIRMAKREREKLKALIVEDDETSEKLLEILLKPCTREILKTKTGTDAVRLCLEYPDIDLILMDIRMNNMDGYEATRRIRDFNKRVVIIAQTSSGMVGDREKAMEAGCNDYISKPVNRKLLRDLIRKHCK